MAVIPTYWYVEPVDGGDAFQLAPARVRSIGPDPFICEEEATAIDTQTGEIYGQAVLMGSLPRTGFRYLGNLAEQVILPYRTAVSLENLKNELQALGFEHACPEGHLHCLNRPRHFRVQVLDTVRVSLHCNLHWEGSVYLARHAVRTAVGECR